MSSSEYQPFCLSLSELASVILMIPSQAMSRQALWSIDDFFTVCLDL